MSHTIMKYSKCEHCESSRGRNMTSDSHRIESYDPKDCIFCKGKGYCNQEYIVHPESICSECRGSGKDYRGQTCEHCFGTGEYHEFNYAHQTKVAREHLANKKKGFSFW